MPAPERDTREETLERARDFQEIMRQFAEKDRELRIRYQILTEQQAVVRARIRAKLGL